jgi:predicted NAD-dependent protein-ADP-ribosyltransferase YbiA (DUF1768 family)
MINAYEAHIKGFTFKLFRATLRASGCYSSPAWTWRITGRNWHIAPHQPYAQRQYALIALQNAARQRCRVALLASDLRPASGSNN